MLNFLGWTARYPFLQSIAEGMYYASIFGALIFFSIKAAEKVIALGYSSRRVTRLFVLTVLASIPLGYIGSRAAGMLYLPFEQWRPGLLLDSIWHGSSHTFHASILLPAVFVLLLAVYMRFNGLEVMDAIFLYMPLAHAVGRVSCLIIGCCWGKYVTLRPYGWHVHFYNPVPAYAIAANICLFYFLQRLYSHVYAHADLRQRYHGVVFSFYLMAYGAVRIVLEVFRRERKILYSLTQAQIAMLLFILLGLILFSLRLRTARKARLGADDFSEYADWQEGALRQLCAAGGLVVFYLLVSFAVYYLTRSLELWPWPFQPAQTVAQAYSRVGAYAPMLLVPLASLFWLATSGVEIAPQWRWQRFSSIFLLGLAVSVYYALDLLVFRHPQLRPPAFWPPVVMLSAMNAVAEEIMYRLAAYRLLRRAQYPAWVANLVQSLLYALIHFMVAGVLFGILAFIYGWLMGEVVRRNQSLLPAIICHFIIDLGCIGYPLLHF